MTTTALPRPAELTSLPHSGLSVAEFYSMHFMAAVFPLTAGILLYGWRAALAVILVEGGTACGIAVWRRIGPPLTISFLILTAYGSDFCWR